MWLIFVEAGMAAVLLIAIVVWTMRGRHEPEQIPEDRDAD